MHRVFGKEGAVFVWAIYFELRGGSLARLAPLPGLSGRVFFCELVLLGA